MNDFEPGNFFYHGTAVNPWGNKSKLASNATCNSKNEFQQMMNCNQARWHVCACMTYPRLRIFALIAYLHSFAHLYALALSQWHSGRAVYSDSFQRRRGQWCPASWQLTCYLWWSLECLVLRELYFSWFSCRCLLVCGVTCRSRHERKSLLEVSVS